MAAEDGLHPDDASDGGGKQSAHCVSLLVLLNVEGMHFFFMNNDI